MSQRANWKRTAVIWVTLLSAAAAYSLTPETWSFFVAAAIVLCGWFLWDAMPKTIGGDDADAARRAAEPDHDKPGEGGWGEIFSVVTGSLFFGLLAALILPGIGDAFGLSARPVYAMGTVLAFAFGLWVYRAHRIWGALAAIAAFLIPVVFMVYQWYRAP